MLWFGIWRLGVFSLDNGHFFFKSTRGGRHHDQDFAYIHHWNSFRYTKTKSEVLGQNMTKFRKKGLHIGTRQCTIQKRWRQKESQKHDRKWYCYITPVPLNYLSQSGTERYTNRFQGVKTVPPSSDSTPNI